VEAPTERLGSHVAGTWRLLYTTVRETRFPAVVGPRVTSLSRSSLSLSTSTSPGSFGLGEQITIRGGTRTKLGLRGALTLGELQQVITCDSTGACGDAINNVAFSLAGMAQGSFTVAARYSVASPTRCVRVQNTHTHTHAVCRDMPARLNDTTQQGGHHFRVLPAGAEAAAGHFWGPGAAAAVHLQPGGVAGHHVCGRFPALRAGRQGAPVCP
jgi:hypothetical protein